MIPSPWRAWSGNIFQIVLVTFEVLNIENRKRMTVCNSSGHHKTTKDFSMISSSTLEFQHIEIIYCYQFEGYHCQNPLQQSYKSPQEFQVKI